MNPLQQLWEQETRVAAGLMSGTSLDGVDAVVARLSGSGPALEVEQHAFVSVPYPESVRTELLAQSDPETSSVRALSQLNVRLAHLYAEAVGQAAEAAGMAPEAIDLVGSHGQTVHHVPEAAPCTGRSVTSTLQIGDPSVLANLLGVPVVGDFRLADMALGGQGAPLVPYFDYVYFTDPEECRGVLNIGGIANLTVLPRGARAEEVRAFDTGPGNMVVDALAERLFGMPYDADGAHAASGQVDDAFLAELLTDDYLLRQPPKSTGRERYGAPYVDRLADAWATSHPEPEPADLLATATALTAASIYQAYARYVRDACTLDALIVSGGGVHNRFLMDRLARHFEPIPVHTAADYGLDPDAKEALCFAVLAHEAANGVPTNLPSVTGASRATILGKLCVPGRADGAPDDEPKVTK